MLINLIMNYCQYILFYLYNSGLNCLCENLVTPLKNFMYLYNDDFCVKDFTYTVMVFVCECLVTPLKNLRTYTVMFFV